MGMGVGEVGFAIGVHGGSSVRKVGRGTVRGAVQCA
jgi:hypothetical protein